jgi:hypothetical protein
MIIVKVINIDMKKEVRGSDEREIIFLEGLVI